MQFQTVEIFATFNTFCRYKYGYHTVLFFPDHLSFMKSARHHHAVLSPFLWSLFLFVRVLTLLSRSHFNK